MLPYTLMPLQPDGAVNFRVPHGGSWSSIEAQNHINCFEMLAIKLGLECFQEKVRHQHVKLMVAGTHQMEPPSPLIS